jgi:hypothetical protein
MAKWEGELDHARMQAVLNGDVRQMTRCPKLRWSRCERTSERDCAAPAKACERTNRRHSGGELVGHILIAPNPLRKSVFI